MSDKRYMINPDVSCRRASEGAALLNPDTDKSVAINAVGYLIWQVLARPCTQSEIIAHLAETCQDVPADQVALDVTAFLQALQPRGFVGEVLDEESPLPDTAVEAYHSPVESILSNAPPEQESPHVYHGHSMVGTFYPGDYLTVEPATITSVRPGDVVIYRGQDQTGEASDIVHRVVAVTPGGLVTRGDNNPGVDNGLVTQDILLGRVTHRERGGQVRRVGTGRWGAIQLWARRAWRRVRRPGWRLLRVVGRPAYRWLRASGLARRLWQPAITRLLVTAGDDPQVQYVSGRRTVARWHPTTGRFSCRKPYDLIILRPDGRGSVHD
jgi:signal peptidase I